MRGCLTDDELAAAQADLAGRRQREHLAACELCARRYTDLSRALGTITRALVDAADEAPARRAMRVRRRAIRWLAVSGAVAAMVAAIIWLDTVVWKAIAPAEPADPHEITALLDQMSRLSSGAGDAAADGDALIRQLDAATSLDVDDCAGAACTDDATPVSEVVNGE